MLIFQLNFFFLKKKNIKNKKIFILFIILNFLNFLYRHILITLEIISNSIKYLIHILSFPFWTFLFYHSPIFNVIFINDLRTTMDMLYFLKPIIIQNFFIIQLFLN